MRKNMEEHPGTSLKRSTVWRQKSETRIYKSATSLSLDAISFGGNGGELFNNQKIGV